MGKEEMERFGHKEFALSDAWHLIKWPWPPGDPVPDFWELLSEEQIRLIVVRQLDMNIKIMEQQIEIMNESVKTYKMIQEMVGKQKR